MGRDSLNFFSRYNNDDDSPREKLRSNDYNYSVLTYSIFKRIQSINLVYIFW